MGAPAAANGLTARTSLLAAGLLALALFLLYFETTWSMVSIWARSETFAHGFLILPISLWLVWRQQPRLQGLAVRPAMGVALLLLLPASAWLVAALVGVSVVAQFALITMVIIACWAALGHQLARALAFPLLFLFFAVPVGQGLILPMMEFTATSTVWMVQLTGIPVFREDLNFTLPSGTWSVVEACSGVRYIIASVTVGTLYAYLTYRSLPRRLLFILVSALVPVFANSVRAFLIVMLGHYSDMTVAVGADHLVYGWAFFGLVMFVLFYLGAFFRQDLDEPLPASAASGDPDSTGGSRARLLQVCLLSLLLASLAPVLYAFSGAALPGITQRLAPAPAPGWQPLARPHWHWRAPSLASGEQTAYYRSGDRELGLAIQYVEGAVSSSDVAGSSGYFVVEETGPLVVASGRAGVALPGGGVLVDQALVRDGGDTLLAWSWYVIDGVSTTSAYEVKVRQALARLRLERHRVFRVVLSTAAEAGDTGAADFLQRFVAAHGEQLYTNLAQVGRVHGSD